MIRYIGQRLLLAMPVVFGVSVVVFLMIAAVPGDPALAILGPYANAENLARLRGELGLDRTLVEQYVIWLGNVLSGDLGQSYSLDRPVADEIGDRIGPTLLLSAAALLLSVVLGFAAGTLAAARQFSLTDRSLTLAVLLGISIPPFWLAMMLILVFAAGLNWFPVSGMFSVFGDQGLRDLLHHLVLPALAMAAVPTGVIARFARTLTLEALGQNHVRAARAGGLRERQVITRHVSRNALVPLLPVIALQIGFLLGGSVYIETVFQWPGIGWMLVRAIETRDILLVQGGVLVVATFYVMINLAADVGQRILDPRVRQ